ncbi:MAG TPA: DUF1616 domain-containing protein, partial [Anaerolineae bacterium]|nr:DUF1616 domain-containing protein [Anaerolineae bacterium]
MHIVMNWMNWRREELWIAGGVILADAAIFFTDVAPLRYLAALLLLCLLPGLALVEALFAHRRGPSLLEKAALSVGAGFAMTAPATLLLHYLPGKMTLVPALAVYNLLILVPLCWRVYLTPTSLHPPSSLLAPSPEAREGRDGGG